MSAKSRAPRGTPAAADGSARRRPAECGEEQRIAVDDPLQRAKPGAELALQHRQRDVHHRPVRRRPSPTRRWPPQAPRAARRPRSASPSEGTATRPTSGSCNIRRLPARRRPRTTSSTAHRADRPAIQPQPDRERDQPQPAQANIRHPALQHSSARATAPACPAVRGATADHPVPSAHMWSSPSSSAAAVARAAAARRAGPATPISTDSARSAARASSAFPAISTCSEHRPGYGPGVPGKSR